MHPMDLETGNLKSLSTSEQSDLETERENTIVSQVNHLHHSIGSKKFVKDVIEQISLHLAEPSTSDSTFHEAIDRYMKSFGEADFRRFQSDIQVFRETGEVSSFFTKGQELDAFAADELCWVVHVWVKSTKVACPNGRCRDQEGKRENDAASLLLGMDMFKEKVGFKAWTRELLNMFRCNMSQYLDLQAGHGAGKRRRDSGGEDSLGSKRAKKCSQLQDHESVGKRRRDSAAEEPPEAKRHKQNFHSVAGSAISQFNAVIHTQIPAQQNEITQDMDFDELYNANPKRSIRHRSIDSVREVLYDGDDEMEGTGMDPN